MPQQFPQGFMPYGYMTPPPVTPGAGIPQMDYGQQPVSVPSFDKTLFDKLTPTAEQLQPLKDLATTQSDLAKKAVAAYSDGGPNLSIARPEATGFSQWLQGALQQQIMQSFQEQNTFGSRFNSGFDMGQKIAAALVVPAIGLFSKAGGAGAVQATEAIKKHVAQGESQRAQQKAQNNQILMNLSQLYENMSPDSAKNQAAYLKSVLDLNKWQYEEGQKALGHALTATGNAVTAQDKLLEAQMEPAQKLLAAKLGLYGHELQSAGLQRGLNKDAYDQNVQDPLKNQQAQTGLFLQGQNLQQRQTEHADQLKQNAITNQNKEEDQALANKKFDQEGGKVRMQAADDLSKWMTSLATKVTTPDKNGKPKYAGMADMLRQNPALLEIYKQKAQTAGINLDPDHFFELLQEQQGAKPKAGGSPGLDVGGLVNQAAQSVGSLFSPKQAPAAPMTTEQLKGMKYEDKLKEARRRGLIK